jgi:hypothetical protein
VHDIHYNTTFKIINFHTPLNIVFLEAKSTKELRLPLPNPIYPTSHDSMLSCNLEESSLHRALQMVVLPIPPTPYMPTTQALELEDT